MNWNRLKKRLSKIRFSSLFFLFASFISISFAWFAFNNTVNTELAMDIKSWKVTLNDSNNNLIEENISFDIDDFYPGMDNYSNSINVVNDGEVDGYFTYKITYLRILDDEIDVTNQDNLINDLAWNYPFIILFKMESNIIPSGNSSLFNISVSWPLDSGDDTEDSNWGNLAYNFKQSEQTKKNNDSSYEIRKEIDIRLELKVEQSLDDDYVSDKDYISGKSYIYNSSTNNKCLSNGSGCNTYYVIDNNNLFGDQVVHLLSDPNDITTLSNYTFMPSLGSNLSIPSASIILKLFSNNIYSSYLHKDNLSDRIIGNVTDSNYSTILSDVSSNNGYFYTSYNSYGYLSSSVCYWTSTVYSTGMHYAIKTMDNKVYLYGESDSTNCKVVPMYTLYK